MIIIGESDPAMGEEIIRFTTRIVDVVFLELSTNKMLLFKQM